jgi:hypothetical protein
MAKGSISATAVASELVPADEYRGEVIIQHTDGDAVYLEFGDGTPVVGEGLVLSSTFPVIMVDDHRAPLAVKGICDTDESATGTYTTD